MNNKEKEVHVSWLERLLQNFLAARKRGKETNDNKERARSIAEIQKITSSLEQYIQNDEDLLKQITGSEIELARAVDWDDVVRPTHFEEDLRNIIQKLREEKR